MDAQYDVCHSGTWEPLDIRYGLGPTDDATHGVLMPRMIVVHRDPPEEAGIENWRMMRYRTKLLLMRLGMVAFVVAVVVLLLVCLGGCVSAREVAGIRADIDTVAGQVNELGLTVGDVTVQGGQGDSITMWILAAGAAVVYPVLWRPIRKRLAVKG